MPERTYISIPVEPHIRKFAQYEYQTTGRIQVNDNILVPYDPKNTNWKKYFQKEWPVDLEVEMYNATLRKQFYFVRYLDQLFKYKLHTFAEACAATERFPTKNALEYFLYTLLDLEDAEYKIDRARKSYHRYQQGKKQPLYLLTA